MIFSIACLVVEEDGSECEAEDCELWVRIPEEREKFTHERVLGCCLDCEERKIEYWVDGESKAVFTDIAIGNGMMPALSFTGNGKSRKKN